MNLGVKQHTTLKQLQSVAEDALYIVQSVMEEVGVVFRGCQQ